MQELAEWDTFYVIAGSAAGGLIGLQFVVMALIAENPPPRVAEASRAFTSPTIAHFSCILLWSLLVRAPWHSMAGPAAAGALVGLGGLGYQAVVTRRMVTQEAYEPVLEDWVFHMILPVGAFLALAAFSVASWHHPVALFGIGFAALLLLFTAVHNAWDGVAHLVLVVRTKNGDRSE